MTTIGIHQPEYLPWLGFFKKMIQCDIFVLYDDVQFERKSWQNRNSIKTHNGSTLLTVPVKAKFESLINDVKIDNTQNWSKKHIKSIYSNYIKSRYFEKYFSELEKIYKDEFLTLIELNTKIIKFINAELNINNKILFSSEFNTKGTSAEKILEICKILNADTYITGTSWASKHLIIEDFKNNNIEIEFQNLTHPIYNQCHKPFLSNMSTIDLLFNEGSKSSEILIKSKTI